MLPLYTLLGTLVLFSPQHASCFAAANHDTLTVGQELSVGDKLVSRNGKFAVGFFTFQSGPSTSSKSSNTTASPRWYLGIWYNKIPVFTTVWVANRDNPITHDAKLSLTQLKISRDGNLVILDGATKSRIIWSTVIINSTETGRLNTSAVLLNSGNLVVITENSSNPVTLWQSFDYPTDVVLPGAKIGWNKVTGLTRQYISRKSMIDPGTGSFCTELQINGALVHRSWNTSNVFWSWGTVRSSAPKLVPLLQSLLDINPETRGLIRPDYINNSEEEYYNYTLLNESIYIFYVHDISGQTKLNVWSQAKQSWQTLYTHPISPCTAYATCGPFTVCSGNSNPFCGCMESFSQKSPGDWELGDHTGGCVRDTPLDCTDTKNKTSSTDIFHPIAHVTLPNNPEIIKDATTQSKCIEACLSYCPCTAYSYNNSICSIWNGDLVDVKKNDGTENNSEDVLYLRLAATDLEKLRKNTKRKPVARVIVVTSIITFGSLMLIMLLLLMWRNKSKWYGVGLRDSQCGGGIITFRYSDLNHATKSFSEKLGTGGFGSVFKGVLSDQTTIAVKRLDGARQGEKQFRAEVSSIGLIQHINLVRLIGFCCEGDNRLLVYEHMLNGSLDAHLFGSNPSVLDWNARYQIAMGVARGLSYLHHSCRECIIHCDIKPENILLDASFIPKIADFGMAAFVGRDFSRVLTTLRGTAGYLAPEWLSGVAITPKVDVYSFGMVLLEIISGKRKTHEQVYTGSNHHVAYFPVQAILKLQAGDVSSLVDPQLHGDFDLAEVERVCKVACWCIQDDESDRPTMGELVQVLEGLQELDVPPMPRLLAAITHGIL
ncbi:hypothetical protein PAHAL_8G114800 [Panicum hallii]|jgi:hypothetical protein|uniref:Receptor-like serine/threonine-protein kinase n=1 Tax=Panicum hallii TaxID=206008 RepID=A0A2S3IE86_9POAL|nr:G-type lectin S-receptor-like serine/threonine-protein kinase At2g19130 [Panicum hallii]PAN41981.1 hypothetical protein PAHAL_8G114800 [Panicum hallii]